MKTKLPLLALLLAAFHLPPATAHAAPNYALSFNGTSAYVDTSTAVIPASGDFTVELWFHCPIAPNTHKEMLSQGSGGNALYIGTDTANNFRLGDGWGTVSQAIPVPIGGWHHVALVKSSTNTIFFLDGTNRLSRGSAMPNPAASTGFRLGRQFGSLSEFWPGSLDDVRIWNRALSAEEIQTNRTKMLTGTEAGLVAAWEFEEGTNTLCTSIGSSKITCTTGGATWTNSGVAWTVETPVVVPTDYAALFNGSSSYLDAGMAVIPTNGDFTVECWAVCLSSAGYREIFSQGSGGNALYIGADTANYLRLGDGWGAVSPAVPFPMGGWHHFAVVKSGTNAIFYLDGTNRLSRGATIPNPTATTGFRLGRQYGTYGEYWPGGVDDVRIWNKALGAADIQASYAQSSVGNAPGLIAAWAFNEGAGLTATAIGSTNIVLPMTNGGKWMASGVARPPVSPVILAQPTNVTAFAGTAAQLSVVATGTAPLYYQWYRQNYGAVAGATNATLAWNSLAASNAGNYYVVVSNVLSASTSHQALVVPMNW